MKKVVAALAATVAHRGETQALEHAATAPRHGGGTPAPKAVEAKAVVEPPKVDPLSKEEKATLKKLEGVIERGIKVFIEVGDALTGLRDERLYRETHPTFEAYCRERWGFSKTHANRLIQSASVAKNLAPIGVIPQSESQVRLLAELSPVDQVKVFKRALKVAQGKPTAVTARLVQETAEKLGLKTVTSQASTTSAGHAGSRTANVIGREVVIEAITDWATDNWDRASTLTADKFVREIKEVINGL